VGQTFDRIQTALRRLSRTEQRNLLLQAGFAALAAWALGWSVLTAAVNLHVATPAHGTLWILALIAVGLAVAEGGGKPPLRYVGVVEVFPGRGTVQLKAEPVKDMNAFCSGCHPSEKEPIKAGQIVRDLHASGLELTGRYFAQVGKFNKEYIEKKRKEGKERPPEPVVLEERVVIVAGKEVKKFFYTCESCHTLHWKTPWGKYARAAFLEKGTLCAGCHY